MEIWSIYPSLVKWLYMLCLILHIIPYVHYLFICYIFYYCLPWKKKMTHKGTALTIEKASLFLVTQIASKQNQSLACAVFLTSRSGNWEDECRLNADTHCTTLGLAFLEKQGPAGATSVANNESFGWKSDEGISGTHWLAWLRCLSWSAVVVTIWMCEYINATRTTAWLKGYLLMGLYG